MDLNFFSHTKQNRTINPNRSIESRSLIAVATTSHGQKKRQQLNRWVEDTSHCGKGNEEINVQITETQHISLGAAPSKRDSFIRPGTKDRSLRSFLQLLPTEHKYSPSVCSTSDLISSTLPHRSRIIFIKMFKCRGKTQIRCFHFLEIHISNDATWTDRTAATTTAPRRHKCSWERETHTAASRTYPWGCVRLLYIVRCNVAPSNAQQFINNRTAKR